MMLTKSRTPLVEFLKTNAKLQFLPALSKQINITIFPPLDSADIFVDIDPVKLGLVFGNLLSNAVKFTPPNGRIDVTMSVDNSTDGGKTLIYCSTMRFHASLCNAVSCIAM